MFELPASAPQILICAFFAILFLQSGLDKVLNYKDNLVYFTAQFKNSPLASSVVLMLPLLTLMELGTGFLSLLGAGQILINGKAHWAAFAPAAAAVTLLALFFGQRMAKDYGGAAGIVPYFLVAIFGIYLFQS